MKAIYLYRGLAGLLAVSAVTGIHVRVKAVEREHAQQESPVGRFTADQMCKRALDLCARIDPHRNDLRITAEIVSYYSHCKTICPEWMAMCTNSEGKDVACFRWNAGSGDLVSASYNAPDVNPAGLPTITDQQADQVAQGWSRRLGLIKTGGWSWS